MFNHIDFMSGKITFIDDGNYFEEDLLQVEYPNGFLLDAGWYNEKMSFIIYIIKDCNWDNPVARYTTQDKQEAVDLVLKSIA